LRERVINRFWLGCRHLVPQRDIAKLGYDLMVDVPDSLAGSVAPASARFLNGKPAQPFFLDVGLEETHRAFFPPGVHEDPRYTLPTAADTRYA